MDMHLFQFFGLIVSGWINRRQKAAVDYLKEENRILLGKLKGNRIRFTDIERRRLAAKRPERLGGMLNYYYREAA